MKKILLVSCEGLGRGGVQAVIMSIVRTLHTEFIFDILLFTNDIRAYDNEFMSYGGQILRIPHYEGSNRLLKRADYYLRGIKTYLKIKKMIREHGPYDVIHCNNEFESALCVRAAKKFNIPIRIVHSHIIHENEYNFVRKLLNYFYRKIILWNTTNFVGCSLEACESLFGKNQKLMIIPNPYDETKFYYRDKRECKNIILTQIGRYCSLKNQSFSLEIVKEILSKYPNVKMNFIGFGDEYLYFMKEKAKELDISEHIYYYPADTDSSVLLGESSYFLFPSLNEGFGIVLIEAQAVGVKCFVSSTVPQSTNCGGCVYLDLSKGAKYWAEKIMDDFKYTQGKHSLYDCEKFTSENTKKIYKKNYGEELL